MGDRAQYVTVVNPTDVLFGRGSGPNDHEGNIRFRNMVAKRKTEYMSTNHRQTKATIAKDVVNSVYQSHGRFLKKLEASELQKLGFPPSTEVYQIVDDDTVMEKAKQALRQNRDKNSDGKKGATSPKQSKRPVQVPVPVLNKTDIALPNYSGSLQAHETLEPLPIPGMVNPLNAAGQQDHARPRKNPGYAKYTQQLEGLANQEKRNDPSPELLRRGPRRASIQSMQGGRRDSLQLSDIMYKDGDGMSAMMESFKGMSTTGEYTSTDSIGTIDNMFGDATHHMSGISNMSNMSLSSVFNSTNEKLSSKDSQRTERLSLRSNRSRDALRDTQDAVWSFEEQSPSMGAGNSLWPLEEQQKTGLMNPPANRAMTAEQIASALMAEPLQESSSGTMMSTSDYPVGMSTGSLMMTSMDSISEQPGDSNHQNSSGGGQQSNGSAQRILPF